MIHDSSIIFFKLNCKQILGKKFMSIFFSNKDKAFNHSAEGCRRHESGTCKNPHMSTTKYGLIIPFVVLLIGVLLLGIIHVNLHFIPIDYSIPWHLNKNIVSPSR